MKLKGHGVVHAVTITARFPFCLGTGMPLGLQQHYVLIESEYARLMRMMHETDIDTYVRE
jgi:hypothetical protein